MNAKEKQAIETEIDAQLAALRKTITDLEGEIKPIAPDVGLGRLTRMEAIGSQKINEAALRDARKKVSMLERAKKKFATGEYGLCMHCGSEIPFGRLFIMPEAENCVNCR